MENLFVMQYSSGVLGGKRYAIPPYARYGGLYRLYVGRISHYVIQHLGCATASCRMTLRLSGLYKSYGVKKSLLARKIQLFPNRQTWSGLIHTIEMNARHAIIQQSLSHASQHFCAERMN